MVDISGIINSIGEGTARVLTDLLSKLGHDVHVNSTIGLIIFGIVVITILWLLFGKDK